MMNKVIISGLLVLCSLDAMAQNNIDINSKNIESANPQAVRNLLMQPLIKGISKQEVKNRNQENSKGSIAHLDFNHSITNVLPMHATSNPLPINELSFDKRMFKKNNIKLKALDKRKFTHLSSSAVYHLNAPNYISSSGINSIVAPVAIAGFVPQPGRVSFKWINHNHGIVFQLLNPSQKTFQAMIYFNTGKPPLSVVFHVVNSIGRVISIPSGLSGTSKIAHSALFASYSEYDQKILNIMNTIIDKDKLGSAWNYNENKKLTSPYKEFNIEWYKHWYNQNYNIKEFKLCSRKNGSLYLSESDFTNGLTMAALLTRHHLTQGQCTRLIVFSGNEKHENSQVPINLISPGGRE